MTQDQSDAPLLDSTLLAALERRWRDQGWAAVAWLRPGLSDEELDAATTPLGLKLPPEARLWWSWHDGVALPDDVTRDQLVFGGPGFVYLSLSAAVRRYEMMRDIAKTLVESDPNAMTQDELWHPQWFPVTVAAYGAVVACDCGDPGAERTPIRPVDWASQLAGPIKARSFGEMVTWWLDAIDQGAWWYEPAEERWNRDYTALDPRRELTRLV